MPRPTTTTSPAREAAGSGAPRPAVRGRRLRHAAVLRGHAVLVAALFLLLCGALPVAAPAVARAAADIPGVPLPPSPVQGAFSGPEALDVYSIQASFWDRLSLTLTGDQALLGDPAQPAAVAVYGPDAVSVTSSTPIAVVTGSAFPLRLTYSHLPSTGTYYIAVSAESPDASGQYSLAWTCKSPVMVFAAPRAVTVCRGRPVRISGLVKRAADSTPIAGQRVILLRSSDGDGWVQTQSATTDARGEYGIVVRPQRSRYYRVMSAGTTSLLAGYSSPRIKITVRR